jgi:hypothetical protein
VAWLGTELLDRRFSSSQVFEVLSLYFREQHLSFDISRETFELFTNIGDRFFVFALLLSGASYGIERVWVNLHIPAVVQRSEGTIFVVRDSGQCDEVADVIVVLGRRGGSC